MKNIAWKNISTKNKLIIAVPILATIMWLVMTYLNLNRINEDTKHIISNYFKAGANEYVALIGNEMKAGNDSRVRRITYNFIENNIFLNALIISSHGDIIFKSEHVAQLLVEELNKNIDIEHGRELLGYYYYPIMDGNGIQRGAALLEPPSSFAAYTYNRRVYQNLSFAFGLLLLEISILVLILSKIFRPLEQLSNNVHEMASQLPDIGPNMDRLRDFIGTSGNSEMAMLGKQIFMFVEKMLAYKEKSEEQAHLAAIGSSAAMVAHDARKPLSSMKALLTALPVIKDDPEQLQKMILAVDRNIANTNAMLNDILDFSRDATALNISNHDPQGVITSALGDSLRNHAGSKVKIDYDLEHEHVLKVDGDRIIRVLTNIIDNALDAMMDESGKTVGHLWIKTEEHQSNLIIKLIDNGPGIPEHILPRIFDPFFTQGKKGGTGLGLAICQKIVSMHGGTLSARNREVKRGAEIMVKLPSGTERSIVNSSELIRDSNELKAFREEENLRVEYGDTANTAEFMRINKERGRRSYLLVVDDEPLFRSSILNSINGLEQVRDHVMIVESGDAETALKLMSVREFDYVVADIDLGKNRMNGYEFVQEIIKKYPKTYTLIHSNKRKEELDIQLRGNSTILQGRFMGFLPKPMKTSEMLQFLACKTFEAPKNNVASGQAPKKNLLLLNDDKDFNTGMRLSLMSGVLQIVDVTSISDALKCLEKRTFDVILSDINLGEGNPDGYEFLRLVKESRISTPFYFLSGYSENEAWPRAKELGADGFIQLPIELDELKNRIDL